MSRMQPISVPKSERNASQSKKKKVELDLPEILEGELRKEAENECRTLEQHIIYILKNRTSVLRETRIMPIVVPINETVHCGDPRPSPFNWDFPRNWDDSPRVTC